MSLDEKLSHPVDTHVGNRVRLRRKFLGISQSDLGDKIGLTFQQVQKYERGANRISASKLFEISHVLKVPVSYFFEGAFADGDRSDLTSISNEVAVNGFLLTTEGVELAQAFPNIRSPRHRRKILDLVKALAEEVDERVDAYKD